MDTTNSRRKRERGIEDSYEYPRTKRGSVIIEIDSSGDEKESECTEGTLFEEEEDLVSSPPPPTQQLIQIHKPFARKIDYLEDELIRKSRRFTLQSSATGEVSLSQQLAVALPASITGSPVADKPLAAAWLYNDKPISKASTTPKPPLVMMKEATFSSSSFSGDISHRDFFLPVEETSSSPSRDSDSDMSFAESS